MSEDEENVWLADIRAIARGARALFRFNGFEGYPTSTEPVAVMSEIGVLVF